MNHTQYSLKHILNKRRLNTVRFIYRTCLFTPPMKTQQITQINEALLVLRHFIDLSARLLPFLEELQSKDRPSLEEQHNLNKIVNVYQSYTFDTNTSRTLLNSNVLELIKESFEALNTTCPDDNRRPNSRPLRKFLLEYKRLSDNWVQIGAN